MARVDRKAGEGWPTAWTSGPANEWNARRVLKHFHDAKVPIHRALGRHPQPTGPTS